MKDGKPASKSELPNNPAALVRISKLVETEDAKPSLELAPTGDGIVFQVQRGAQVVATGKRQTGRTLCARMGGLEGRTRPVFSPGRTCR